MKCDRRLSTKIYGKYFADNAPVWELNRVHIIPSIGFEWIVNDGITQDKIHLAFGHAGF